MIAPTPDQLARAYRVRATIHRQQQAIATLQNQVDAARVALDADEAKRRDRINFIWQPGRLAGVMELFRRTDRRTRLSIDADYRRLLTLIKDADKTNPFSVDYAALPKEARPYLLAPFLNILVGDAYPRLDFERTDIAAGRLVYLVTGGPADPLLWQPHMDKASAWLGDHWALTAHTVSTITLTRQTPLPAQMPFDPRRLKPGHLYLGADLTSHQPVYLPFADMTSGTFIPGTSGGGKSNAVHVLLKSLFANLNLFAAVYLVDGKDGVAFNRYRNVAPGKVHVLWDEKDLWELTTTLVATMRQRNHAQREAGLDKTTRDFIAVVIDEMATYTAKPSGDPKHPDNKRHGQFIDELAMLAKRGRSTGLRLVITAQEPVVNDIPANVRANCSTIISFRLPLDAHATAVFGQLEGLPLDPRKIPRGRALIKNGMSGTLQAVQFPLIPAPKDKA